MPRAYVSVGSNVDREANIRAALRALRQRYGDLHVSSVYETEAVGFEGRDFYNLVLSFDTSEVPMDVSQGLKAIETRQGRTRGGPRFADRTLDLDLLLYDDLVIDEGDLKLPRPEILEYAFVLGPLAEIAPDRVHPLRHKTFAELWADFDGADQTLRRVRAPVGQQAD